MPHRLEQSERSTLAARLAEARACTDEIFDRVLDPAALYERPIPERHRLVFYLGHVEAFDWNLIARQAFGLDSFHERFDQLFAFGIDPVDGGLPNEPVTDWPRRPEIEAYNRRTREVIDACVAGDHLARVDDEDTVLGMAIEHRLMHAETLAYLLHRLPYSAKHAPAASASEAPAADGRVASDRATLAIPAGRATLGQRRADGGFGWDNEFEAHAVDVPAFAIEPYKVTNARFLEFMKDGGYENRALWDDKDWAWKEASGVRHPAFWTGRDGAWAYHGMFAETPLPLDHPVYVSHAEAAAFARWSRRALPTEAQFHRAAWGTPSGAERQYPWGDAFERGRGNFDFQEWDPTSVRAHPESASAFGVVEPVGNGWEWTSTLFAPFAGFQAHPFYAGYSANFFDGDHYVQKGGSPRTAASMLRRSFRNWFQPRYPYVYAGFRLVEA